MNIIQFDEVGSTNDVASSGDYAHKTYIVAHKQSAGRGQRGNIWESHAGDNLTFSLVINPNHIPAVEQYRISMMAALAASDTIRNAGLQCMIKWPNDLYVADSKIGGILIEHSLMGEMLTRSIVGIGINVNQKDFSPELPNPTSFVKEGVHGHEPLELLRSFAHFWDQRYMQTADQLHADYMERLWRGDGIKHKFLDENGAFDASIDSIAPLTGQLTLKTSEGELRNYWFKEVEFLL